MPRQRPRIGSRYILDGAGIGPALKRLQTDVDTRIYGTRLTLADETVKALRSTTRSRVNVDTGTMRANYQAKVRKTTNRITLLNRSKSARNSRRYPTGFNYPQLYRAGVVRTINTNRATIVRTTRRRVARNPNGPRSSPRIVY